MHCLEVIVERNAKVTQRDTFENPALDTLSWQERQGLRAEARKDLERVGASRNFREQDLLRDEYLRDKASNRLKALSARPKGLNL